MSNLQRSREAAEAATQRRAHLSARALLDGLAAVTARIALAADDLRTHLDARGGAHELAM